MKSWLDVLEALYRGSWTPELQRFRSPFGFRDHARLDDTLASSLVRLSDAGAMCSGSRCPPAELQQQPPRDGVV